MTHIPPRSTRRFASLSRRVIMGMLGVLNLAYPWVLEAAHAALTAPTRPAWGAIWLITALVVPAAGLALAIDLFGRPLATRMDVYLRRLALLTVATPTLFVFVGVIWYMTGTALSDLWPWTVGWVGLLAGAAVIPDRLAENEPSLSPRWRVAHGLGAVAALLYVVFHIANHLGGLWGPETHAAIMHTGRVVYRSDIGELLLVLVLLWQVVSGVRMAWSWSTRTVDAYRVFQIASGVFLSLFILGHMNSVFVFARLYLGIDTNWDFATGAPTGILHDAWNIRLAPHYALAVFLVLAHVVSGLRVIVRHHGVRERVATVGWWTALAASAGIAALTTAALLGVRWT